MAGTRRPLVSILINNHNYGRFLPEAIDSALGQKYDNIEVIVVDDGSTDNSRDVIKSYGDRIVPVLKENGGQASAFNSGFAASKGEIICLLDSDDFFEADKAGAVYAAFLAYPDCGFLVHKMRYVDGGRNETVAGGHLGQNISWAPSGDYREVLLAGRKFGLMLPATSALCFRRALFERICPVPRELTITADNYLKAASLMYSPLVSLDVKLSCQRIHGWNAYTNLDRRTREFRKKSREINKGIAIGLRRLSAAQKASDAYLRGNVKSSLTDLDFRDLAESLFLLGRMLIGRLHGR